MILLLELNTLFTMGEEFAQYEECVSTQQIFNTSGEVRQEQS